MKDLQVVGHSVERSDAFAKATGAAKYTRDLIRPDMLVGKVKWPDYPHAIIKSIDVSAARALPGVETVMLVEDLPGKNGYGPMVADKPVIADGKVCYEGDPVALVAAVDEETAKKAVELIKVEYEVLPAYDNPLDAIKPDAVIIHPDSPFAEEGNICNTVTVDTGDVDEGFAKADIIIENDYELPYVEHCYFEQDIAIAEYDNNTGGLTITSPNQAVFQGRRHLAGVYGLPQAKIRCVCPYVGGGFGGKEDSCLDVSAVAGVLALKTKKTVVFELSREEVFRTTGKRHSAFIHHKLGATKDGKIVAVEATTYLGKGAYVSMSGFKAPAFAVVQRTAIYAAGTYYCPNYRTKSMGVYTNTPYGTAFRGFGVPQATYPMECQMEELAKATGIDSIELRRMNMLKDGDRMVTGTFVMKDRGLGLGECFDKVKEYANWDAPFDHGTGPIKRGRGIAAFMYGTGIPLMFEGANVSMLINTDGSVQLNYSSTEMGQGIATTGAQMCAEVMGMNYKDIEVHFSDTLASPDSGPTVGSRSTVLVGNAIRDAAEQMKNNLWPVAAQLIGEKLGFKVDMRDLEAENSTIHIKGHPEIGVTYAQVVAKAYISQVPLAVIGSWYPPHPGFQQPSGHGPTMHTFAYGAHYVEIAVDTETGDIKLEKSVYACDIGKAINPIIVEGQVEGAAVQAFGYGIMEEELFDTKKRNGKMENATFHSYLIPTAMDVPEHKTIIVECANELGPWGAKGIGEPGIIPGAPAIRNAFKDATGISTFTIPLTPVRVLEAIENAEKK